jgi:DNA-directed RNA polymerase specialized sigma24 family protein
MQEMQRVEWHADGEMKEQIERMASALDRCLQHLNPAQRELIEKYYGTEGQNQIEARKQLAEQFKISLNALRNRAMRIRADLERRTNAALAK